MKKFIKKIDVLGIEKIKLRKQIFFMSLGKILEKEVFKIVHFLADVDTAIVRTCNILCLLLQHTLNNNLPKSICDKDTKRQNVSHAYLKKSSKHLAK